MSSQRNDCHSCRVRHKQRKPGPGLVLSVLAVFQLSFSERRKSKLSRALVKEACISLLSPPPPRGQGAWRCGWFCTVIKGTGTASGYQSSRHGDAGTHGSGWEDAECVQAVPGLSLGQPGLPALLAESSTLVASRGEGMQAGGRRTTGEPGGKRGGQHGSYQCQLPLHSPVQL